LEKIYFENIHKAAVNYPYLDLHMENINYIAHFHEEIEVVYIVSGTVTILTDTETLTGRQGDICIFLPGEIHSFLSVESNQLYIMKMNAQTENIDFSLMRLKKNKISQEDESYTVLRNIIQNIAIEETEKQTGYEFAVRMYINQLIVLIARRLPHELISAEQKKKMYSRLTLLQKVNEYAETHYTENITLTSAAEYCRFSKYYFAHTFKEITGAGFIEHIMMFRLEKSLSMIKLSDENITDIAFACGFSNVRSFNRMFRKYFHMTPTQYRKSLNDK